MVCELLVVTIYQSMFTVCWSSVLSRFRAKLGRMTCACVYTSLYDICYKCQPNLSIREQPLLNALDVFGVGWVIIRPFQVAAAEMLRKVTHDPTYTLLVCAGWWPTTQLSILLVCAGWTSTLNFLSEKFSTLCLPEMFFLVINCRISVFFEPFLHTAHHFKNNQRPKQHQRWKSKEVRFSRKTVSRNEICWQDCHTTY